MTIGASLIKPISITAATLVSSTVPETEFAAYLAATNYAVGAKVIYDSKIWSSVQTPNTGNTPGTNAIYWALASETNRMLMFDDRVSTKTVSASPLVVVVRTGFCDSLILAGLEGAAVDIVARNGVSGPLVYSVSKTLDGSLVSSLAEYLYEPFLQRKTVVLTDLPMYSDLHITVTVSGPGTVACGLMKLGINVELGDAEYGFTVELLDYSKKTTINGVTTFEPGPSASRLAGTIVVDNLRFNKVFSALEQVLGKQSALVTTQIVGYEALIAVGFFRSAPLTLSNYPFSQLNVDFEGTV